MTLLNSLGESNQVNKLLQSVFSVIFSNYSPFCQETILFSFAHCKYLLFITAQKQHKIFQCLENAQNETIYLILISLQFSPHNISDNFNFYGLYISISNQRNTMQEPSDIYQTKRKPRAVSSFLKKTYELLGNEENHGAVRWASNGIGFVVINQDSFSKEILPKYFKHSNYSSFVRQLNMYNFHKIRENNTESYFHHQCFDRNNEEKLSQIKRKPQKKKRKCEDSDEEVLSDHEDKQIFKNPPFKKIKEEPQPQDIVNKNQTILKIQSQKNTNPVISSEYNEERQNDLPNWRSLGVDQQSDDRLSINNEISERIIPRLATRQLFYPSNNNIFPFGGMTGQTSTFCLFF